MVENRTPPVLQPVISLELPEPPIPAVPCNVSENCRLSNPSSSRKSKPLAGATLMRSLLRSGFVPLRRRSRRLAGTALTQVAFATRFGVVATGGILASRAPATASEIVLTWHDNASNETGFRIERGLAGLLWSEVGTVPANTTRFTDDLILPDLLYSYRVCAYNPFGVSAFSNVVTIRVPPPGSPNEPPSISAVADQQLLAGTATPALPFVLSDPDTPVEQLSLTVETSDVELVPLDGLILGGNGAARSIMVRSAPDRTGVATVRLTVADGRQTTSASFQVTVVPASAPPVFTAVPGPADIAAGGVLLLRANATGGGPVTYQWYREGSPIAGATEAEYVVPSAQRFHAGVYQVRATSGGLSIVSPPIPIEVAAAPDADSRLLNYSTRGWCGTGDQVMIPGVVVEGTASKRVLIRAVGPTLGGAPFGIAGALANPQLVLKHWDGSAYANVASNQNWGNASDATLVRQAGADVFAFGLANRSLDAALLADLDPGQFTVVVNDEAGAAGVVLVEWYDLDDETSASRVTNLSNRGFVGTGNNVMIMGLVVAAEGPLTLLLRAVGPGLQGAPFQVAGALRDPEIEIFGPDGQGGQQRILANDDWNANSDSGYTASVAAQVGAFPLASGSLDAALVVTLAPGAYTAIVRGVGGLTGVALMEIYTVR